MTRAMITALKCLAAVSLGRQVWPDALPPFCRPSSSPLSPSSLLSPDAKLGHTLTPPSSIIERQKESMK